MKQTTLTMTVVGLLLLLVGVAVWGPQPVQAGIFDSDAEVTYKEYWIDHDEFTGFCNPDGSMSKPSGTTFIEPGPKCPITMNFTLPDSLANATRAEIYMDMWRNRDEAVGRYRFNGTQNQVHATSFGSEFGRNAFVADVPLDEIAQGLNSITFTGARLYQVQDVAIRLYYDDSNPLTGTGGVPLVPPDGELISIADDNTSGIDPYSGPDNEILMVDGDKLILSANVDDKANLVEFHAFYDGYDEDRDGVFTDWHNSGRNNWFPGGRSSTTEKLLGGTINHIGTKKAPAGGGVVTITWDLAHVVNQSGVRFKIRILDENNNVREGAGGVSRAFTIARNYSVYYYLIPNFEDYGLWMFGSAPATVSYKFDLPSTVDLTRVAEVKLLGAYTAKPHYAINLSSFKTVNAVSTINPTGDEYVLGLSSFSKANLNNGENTITYNRVSGQLNFVEEPGPMFIFRNIASVADTAAPFVISRFPQPNIDNVDTRGSIIVHLGDGGAGVDANSIVMSVDGQPVVPTISGSSVDLILTYTPPLNKPLPNSKTITVTVYGCDLLGNCLNGGTADQFSFETEAPDVIPPTISDIQVLTTDTTAEIDWKTNELADSTVRYGETTGYELPEVTNSTAVTSHALILTGLTPDTIYNYQIRSKDLDDNTGQTSNLTFKTKPSPGQVMSDDFSSCTLDGDVWTFIDPIGDSSYTLNGSTVEITAPAKVSHDIWQDGIEAPRLMQLVKNEDFTAIVKMDSIVEERVQLQGILVQQDANNYLRFTVQHDGSTLSLSIVDGNNGDPKVIYGFPLASTPPYMRVVRLGSTWGFDYSYDGLLWINGSAFSKTLTVSQVGIYAGNSGGNRAPLHVGIFDYFFNSASPIAPEDPPRTLTVNVDGVGTVEQNPFKASYDCNENVALKAVPATDWSFIGWSGAVTGTDPETSFPITESAIVTATFENTLTYTVDVMTEFLGGDNGGLITVEPEKDEYKYNDLITFTAQPITGWAFSGWTGAFNSTNLTETLQITSDVVLTGTFAKQINLETEIISNPIPGQSGPGGEITLIPDKATYDYGETVELQAVAYGGWAFDGWSGDLSGPEITKTLIMTEDKSVSVTFTQGSYTVDATVLGTGGTVTVEPDQDEYLFGEIITVTAVPESDLWDFAGWGGDLAGTGNPAVFPVEKDTVITASFIPDTTPIEIIDYDVQVFPGGRLARITWTTDVPGTSLVEYGLTPFYEVGDESDPALITDHVLDLQNLEPEKLYYFQITSSDQFGNPVTVQDQFSTRAITGIVSDDFALCGGLDANVWTWVDPLDDSSLDMTGNAAAISVPAGTAHDVFTSGNSGARIMQAADDKDFVIEIKFDSTLDSDGAMQGVVIEQDDGDFMRFDFFRRSNAVVVYSAAFQDLTPVYSNNRIKIALLDTYYMRITRSADTWLHEYSIDGTNWVPTSAKPFEHDISVKQVGVFGGNFNVQGNIPAHTVLVDYFFNMDSPIANEDAPYAIAVQTIGNGSVNQTPDQPGYYCGQEVELQAVPDQGWTFAGWNGDVSGTLPVRTVTVERDLIVNALFVKGQTFSAFMPSIVRP